MTQQEYDKKMAVLKEARSKAFQACYEACKACYRTRKAWCKTYKARDKACKAIDDLKESWAKQESEAVK